MLTLETLLKEGTNILREENIQEASLDAWLLLEYVTGKRRAYYFAHQEDAVEEEKAAQYRSLVEQRARHIPLQHLTHQACFMGFDFYVNENVLIPRQDTEVLVEKALEILQEKENPEILDMCTGSGCILLSILGMKADATGVGVDVSTKALEVAKRNVVSLNLEKKAHFIESDLFSNPFFKENSGKDLPLYDILISNPPYIKSEEIETLMEEVRLHDPRIALDGFTDGLYFYRQIIKDGRQFLKATGWILFEIGYDQGEAVLELMQENDFTNVQVIKDLAGLDRVVIGQKA